jgi:hypothetical protein
VVTRGGRTWHRAPPRHDRFCASPLADHRALAASDVRDAEEGK